MVLKFFDVVLKFELPNARVLNFPKISASSLILVVLINGACVYFKTMLLNDLSGAVEIEDITGKFCTNYLF